MSALELLIPTPRRIEIDYVDLAVPPEIAWNLIRHGDLGTSPLVRALFATRTLISRMRESGAGSARLRIDDLCSTEAQPGFAILSETRDVELVVGAIGKVWQLDIPFVFVPDGAAFGRFDQPDFAKVAWAIQLAPLGERDTRVTFELRVDATDEAAWKKLQSYFRVIGPASHFIRRSILASLARQAGTPEALENQRELPGDGFLPDASDQLTDAVTIAATPAEIFPWLLQMGVGRGGFYSVDLLDNHGDRSAAEIRPEYQNVRVGDILPATTESGDGFEVLHLERNRLLVLGGLFDPTLDAQLPFDAERPDRFWQITWSFVLEPIDAAHTKLHVRARAAFSKSERLHAFWIRPVHLLMQRAQLENLARRVEGRVRRDDWHEVGRGLGGLAIMAAAMVTPFRRDARSHWGVDAETASRSFPGDELIASPTWGWTHAVEVDAPTHAVWPWVAQVGADRGGFYSYQWLENLAGCDVVNAETVHQPWAHREGDGLFLHPKMPPLAIVKVEPGQSLVAHAPADPERKREGKGWVEVTWLFMVEPLDRTRCRVISRYRAACADDLATRLQFGPTLLEPVGFAMDRRMLLGIKARAEHLVRGPGLRHLAPPGDPAAA